MTLRRFHWISFERVGTADKDNNEPQAPKTIYTRQKVCKFSTFDATFPMFEFQVPKSPCLMLSMMPESPEISQNCLMQKKTMVDASWWFIRFTIVHEVEKSTSLRCPNCSAAKLFTCVGDDLTLGHATWPGHIKTIEKLPSGNFIAIENDH